MKNIETFALLFSIASFLISAAASWYIYKNNRKISQQQMMMDFFKEIFFDIVITQLPNALNQIRTDENGQYDFEWLVDFENIIKDFRIKSRFYKYYDENFYGEFTRIAEEINTFIGQLSNINEVDNESLEDTKLNLSNLYNDFYEVLFKYYCK